MATFYVHFAILTKPGAGDTFMTIEMQNELKGLQPAEVPLRKVSLAFNAHNC
jgi:dolichyl-phosphate-mannose-protein mannosyltransferase